MNPEQDNDRTGDRATLSLVGIGASAGGIAALREFFADVPEHSGIAFAVVMQLSPEHESSLAEALQHDVRIPVSQVRGRVRLEADHVYVIPPDRRLIVTDGHLELAEFSEPHGRRAPIDTFFRTIADVHLDGMGVILSGSGTDGVMGLKAIKEQGGVTLAQSPELAEYDTMPRAAVATGLVDFVLPARELGAKVVHLRSATRSGQPPPSVEQLPAGDGPAADLLREQLHDSMEDAETRQEVLTTVNDELEKEVNELADTSNDLRNLMAATEIGTLFLDRQLRVRAFTPALDRIFNVMPVDVGRPAAHVTNKLDYDWLLPDCRAVLADLQPIEREMRDHEGRFYLARITPYRTSDDRLAGVVATFTDVTRIRTTQEHLQRSEERFRVMIAATAQIVWAADANGSVTEDSPSWRAFTGQTPVEQMGRGWLDAVHPDDRAAAAAAWDATVSADLPLETEYRLRHAATGEWRHMAVRAAPIRDSEGTVREWVGMNADITSSRRSEMALVEAKLAAERSDRAKSQFLSVLSHELRTPLTAVIGSADVLESGIAGDLTPRQREHLKRMKSCAWHLVSIINEILTYTRSEAGKDIVQLEVADAAAIARDVRAMLEREVETKGVEFVLRGVEQPVQVITDAGKLRQIVTNLVGNAVKFTRRGSVELNLSVAEQHFTFEVRDTGEGIPADLHETIFQPFFQVDSTSTRAQGGTGLGLAVSRRLARAMGGDIDVESAPGSGSTFTLRLPIRPHDLEPSIVRPQ